MKHLQKILEEYGMERHHSVEKYTVEKVIGHHMVLIRERNPTREELVVIMKDIFCNTGCLKFENLQIFSEKTKTQSIVSEIPEWAKIYFTFHLKPQKEPVFKIHVAVNSYDHDPIYENIEKKHPLFKEIQTEYFLKRAFDEEGAKQKTLDCFIEWMSAIKQEFDDKVWGEELAEGVYAALQKDILET